MLFVRANRTIRAYYHGYGLRPALCFQDVGDEAFTLILPMVPKQVPSYTVLPRQLRLISLTSTSTLSCFLRRYLSTCRTAISTSLRNFCHGLLQYRNHVPASIRNLNFLLCVYIFFLRYAGFFLASRVLMDEGLRF